MASLDSDTAADQDGDTDRPGGDAVSSRYTGHGRRPFGPRRCEDGPGQRPAATRPACRCARLARDVLSLNADYTTDEAAPLLLSRRPQRQLLLHSVVDGSARATELPSSSRAMLVTGLESGRRRTHLSDIYSRIIPESDRAQRAGLPGRCAAVVGNLNWSLPDDGGQVKRPSSTSKRIFARPSRVQKATCSSPWRRRCRPWGEARPASGRCDTGIDSGLMSGSIRGLLVGMLDVDASTALRWHSPPPR